jgi:peptide/nickel transport system substrate-binding protein/oligopeptide transport system substrate-binding protein
VYTALYEGLVTYNPFTLQPSPGIAERWETSEDDTVYRFFLRSNARYSNGDRITAGHVRETLLTLIDPDEEAEYANLLDVVKNVREYRNGQISDPSEVGIYAEEEDVVRFELEHPANHLLKILCHHSFSPLHPEMLEGGRWDSPQRLISNGPFYIAESSEDEMLLKKNTQYWDADEVALEALRIVYREDEAQITKDFNRGEIHWTEAPVDYDSIASRDALVVNHLFSTSYYFFSAAEEPYNNPAVRRALALLLRWENIRSSEYMYIPTSTLVPQIGAYPELEGITERNEERALSLLSEEGYPGGSGLPEITIAIPEGEESRRIAEEMQEAWEETLDVKVEIEGNPYRSYYDRLKEQPFTIGTLTWIGDFADPLTFLGMWTSDSNLNISKYEQPQFDSLIQEALPQSGQERYETMSEAEKILLTGAVVLPIKHAPAFNIIDLEYIEGWYPNPLDIHPFKYVRFGTPSIPEGVVRDFSYPGRRAVRAPSAGRPLRSPDVLWKPSTTNWSRR